MPRGQPAASVVAVAVPEGGCRHATTTLQIHEVAIMAKRGRPLPVWSSMGEVVGVVVVRLGLHRDRWATPHTCAVERDVVARTRGHGSRLGVGNSAVQRASGGGGGRVASVRPLSPCQGQLFMKYGLRAANAARLASAPCTYATWWYQPRPAHEIFGGGRV
jgi:hypothetical protein